jgi:hypothetical protein
MPWFKFHKIVRGSGCATYEYLWIDGEDGLPDDEDEWEEFLKDWAEDWADRVNTDGIHRGYRYGFDLEEPSLDVLEKMIKGKKQEIAHIQEQLDVFIEEMKRLYGDEDE